MFKEKEYFYAPVVRVGKFDAWSEDRSAVFPSKKGHYIMSVRRDISVEIDGKIYDVKLQATTKTLQDIVDLAVGDELACCKNGKHYDITNDLVKYKVKKRQ